MRRIPSSPLTTQHFQSIFGKGTLKILWQLTILEPSPNLNLHCLDIQQIELNPQIEPSLLLKHSNQSSINEHAISIVQGLEKELEVMEYKFELERIDFEDEHHRKVPYPWNVAIFSVMKDEVLPRTVLCVKGVLFFHFNTRFFSNFFF